MTGKTREKDKHEKTAPQKNSLKKSDSEKTETEREGNWGEDQQKKSYYYDDAYGYEVYDPNEDDSEENE